MFYIKIVAFMVGKNKIGWNKQNVEWFNEIVNQVK
jgi:hypothetical protein